MGPDCTGQGTFAEFLLSDVACFPPCTMHGGRKSPCVAHAALPREGLEDRGSTLVTWGQVFARFGCELSHVFGHYGPVAIYFMLGMILWIRLLKFWPLRALSGLPFGRAASGFGFSVLGCFVFSTSLVSGL